MTAVDPTNSGDYPCPACASPSRYDRRLDRFFHRDGSDNDGCWLAILRGQRYAGWVDPIGPGRNTR